MIKLNLPKITIPKVANPRKILLACVVALVTGAIVMVGYSHFLGGLSSLPKPQDNLFKGPATASTAASIPPPSQQLVTNPAVQSQIPANGLPVESPQPAASPLKTVVSDKTSPKARETASAGDAQSGKEMFSLQERKEKADLELTISKIENDIKKERIKDQYLSKYPELALGADAAFATVSKKTDDKKTPVPLPQSEEGKPRLPEDSLDRVSLIGVVGSKAVWSIGSNRVTTVQGEVIQGYLVTYVGTDKVVIARNGRTVTYNP